MAFLLRIRSASVGTCPTCEYMSELIRKFEECDLPVFCSECKLSSDEDVKMVKILAPPKAIIFKGDGFYVTDSRKLEKINRSRRNDGDYE